MQEDKSAMRFPQKLWYMLHSGSDAIMWGGTGKTILMNYRVLHGYLQCNSSVFKTTNISSFVRQLNLYGFRKVTSHLQDPLCNSSNPYMHEYIHDYFQFGRPELLSKINRKVLTIRRPHNKSPVFYLKNLSEEAQVELSMVITPLQKARLALQHALQKAAKELLLQPSPQIYEYPDTNFEFNIFNGEHQNENSEDNKEDGFKVFDWMIPETSAPENVAQMNVAQVNVAQVNVPPQPEVNENDMSHVNPDGMKDISEPIQVNYEHTNYREFSSQDQMDINTMSSMPWQPNPEGFSNQFLNMPDLGPDPVDNSIELLAEFDIHHDMDQGIARRSGDKGYDKLNCVLPSINNDPIDNVSIGQEPKDLKNCDQDPIQDHYMDREWDEMLDDMIINRESSSECGSALKDLYSQISRTMDLLNS